MFILYFYQLLYLQNICFDAFIISIHLYLYSFFRKCLGSLNLNEKCCQLRGCPVLLLTLQSLPVSCLATAGALVVVTRGRTSCMVLQPWTGTTCSWRWTASGTRPPWRGGQSPGVSQSKLFFLQMSPFSTRLSVSFFFGDCPVTQSAELSNAKTGNNQCVIHTS